MLRASSAKPLAGFGHASGGKVSRGACSCSRKQFAHTVNEVEAPAPACVGLRKTQPNRSFARESAR
jgi:hypothetical protein